MARPSRVALLAAVLLLTPISVPAQQAGTHDHSADMQRFCSGIELGGGKITQCLQAHQGQLAPACRDFLSRVQANRSSFGACLGDARRHCAGIRPGGGRIIACLSEKRDQLTLGCASALDEAYDLLSSLR